ncbi:UvrD-helicase domain-containing protein [Paenibacillus harenae]|uniref:UvrD-helicase domain-containing protein n=1 Tax=Paenibacillus harenae TaxID=306543 RepID=UPI0027909BD6|nr:UvrD-helicase domain-containing protein [Paenibacillus harenae]MDQ0063477.1 ATP-dependent helicase/nuclease subunit A [Paenibacillus harenae]
MVKQQVDDDQVARERIARDLDVTLLVEAGAGSGKTTSVVGRMIALIKSGSTEVHEIAAITFTNKAASELSSRFRIKLEQELRASNHETEKRRLAQAMARLHEGFIGTIHAFCGRLLRERPIEAKLDPAFREMDQEEDKQFRDDCWDDYLDMLREQGNEHHIDELAEHLIDVEDLRAVYHRVSGYEDIQVHTKATPRPDFDVIRLSLFPLLDEANRYIPTHVPSGGHDELQKLIQQAGKIRLLSSMAHDMNVLTLAKQFDKELKITQKKWSDKEAAKQLLERLHQWQIGILWPFLTRWRAYMHPKLIAFVQPAVKYCRDRRAAEGKLNFQDLLMQTAALLREHREVRAYFAARYTRLFVDEFQDTDPIQAEMMLLLTGTDPKENDWRRQLPRPGSLFIVGDPKQSIYRFRRADISTYNFVKGRVALCGDVLQLTRNFRSVKSIGNYVNYAFESKFAKVEQPSDCQAAFAPMLTQQPNPKGKGAVHGVFTITIPKVDYDRKAVIAELDADRIARYIARACGGELNIQERDSKENPLLRPAIPGDFMILLKHKQFINLYAAKLEQYGVAADTSGSEVLYEEVHTLYQLVQTLGDSSNRIPLLAVLRGMLFGVSDNALYHFRKEAGSLSIYTKTSEEQLTDHAKPVLAVLLKLRGYADVVRELPALAALTHIVHDLGLLPLSAVGRTGALRSGTLLKLLEMVRADSEAASDWSKLTSCLQRLTESRGIEGTSLFAGSGEAVRIMNVHRAKGLEAAIVFLASPCGDTSHDAMEHIDRLSEPPQGHFTISRPKDSNHMEMIGEPAGWERLSERERTFMHAETDRLLYVAATRAKQLLIVSRYPVRPAIDPWSLLASSLSGQQELEDEPFEAVIAPGLAIKSDHRLEEAFENWQAYAAVASQETYQVTSVTALAKGAGSGSGSGYLPRPTDGGGVAFGNTVHRCLQAIGEGMLVEQLPDYCEMVSEQEGLKLEWRGRAMAAIERTIASNLWKRSEQAKQRHFEFSFMIKREQGGQEKLIRGVIDLVFEEEDGWVIVDFKTDQFALENGKQFVEFYKHQVMAYAAEWTDTFGFPVKQAGLYFIHHDKYVEL